MRTILIVFIFLPLAATAQNRLLNKEISISAKDLSIEKILKKITAGYGVNFSYGKDHLALEQLASITVKSLPLGQLLEQLLVPHEITFTVIGNQIVLKKKEIENQSQKKRSKRIAGMVKDAITGESLGFASVSFKGAMNGTITNAEGEFVLLARSDAEDTVKISHLGYMTAEISVSHQGDKALSAELEPIATQLASVEIVSRSAESIVQEAIHRIPENYRMTPYRQRFYLRDRTWADGGPIQASESVYESYRGDVTQEGHRKQVKLLGARRSRYEKKYREILSALRSLNGFDIGVTAYFIFDGDLTRFKGHDTFMGKGNWKHYEFHQEDNTFYDGREVYVISFDQEKVNRSLMKGRFYIDTETYAFVHISQSLSPKGLDHAEIFGPKVLEKIMGLGENVMVDWSQERHYRNVNGKWFLDHMTLKPQLSLIKSKRKFNTSIISESNLVVTEIDTMNILPFADDEVTAARKLTYRLYGEYDYDFWKEQNVIKPDASFDEAFLKIEGQNGTVTRLGKPALINEGSKDTLSEENPTADWTTFSLNLEKDFTHFKFHFSRSDSAIVDSVNQVLNRYYTGILKRYEVKRLPILDIYIYPSVQAYHAAINYPNAPAWMVGSATINKFSIVSPLNPGPSHSFASVLKGVVHEFMHCVHIHIVKNNMSKVKDNDTRWLWEGLACYEGEQFVHPKTLEYVRDKFPTLEALNDAETGEMIYELGYVLVEFIRKTWGQKSVLKLIKTNGDLTKVLDVSEDQFNTMWQQYVTQQYLTE
jgi:hypothetical protein